MAEKASAPQRTLLPNVPTPNMMAPLKGIEGARARLDSILAGAPHDPNSALWNLVNALVRIGHDQNNIKIWECAMCGCFDNFFAPIRHKEGCQLHAFITAIGAGEQINPGASA